VSDLPCEEVRRVEPPDHESGEDQGDRRRITEEDGIQEEWYREAKGMTLHRLPEFLRKLDRDYDHDYGTICHALAAGAVAAATALDRGSGGGITGFQAGAVFWEFYRHWMAEDGPAALVVYEHMLYPQYEYRFQKTIGKSIWEWIQEEAKKRLQAAGDNEATIKTYVTEDGDLRSYESRFCHPDVYAHWQAIASGQVPFGYRVEETR
jgi:hypothetical protein